MFASPKDVSLNFDIWPQGDRQVQTISAACKLGIAIARVRLQGKRPCASSKPHPRAETREICRGTLQRWTSNQEGGAATGLWLLKTLSARDSFGRDLRAPNQVGLKRRKRERDPRRSADPRAIPATLGVSVRVDQVLRSHSHLADQADCSRASKPDGYPH
jgi:hypothetical protein